MRTSCRNILEEIDILAEENDLYDTFFLHYDNKGTEAYKNIAQLVTNRLVKVVKGLDRPYIGKTPEQLTSEITDLSLFTYEGESLESLLDEIENPLLKSNINVTHEKSVAHLHCPPLIPALAAEMIISAYNQSMDSWDQSPAATHLEQEVIQWLTKKFGYTSRADGIFTSGGTQSNYTGLLLARDSFCLRHWNQDVQKQGLPKDFDKMRILCSEEAHFTVKKSASQLGLGEEAVISIQTDENKRLCLKDLTWKVRELRENDLLPFAVVATCGTTDFGSIDPMKEVAEIAKEYGLWFHVDAAFGGALILSHNHAEKLNGIDHADSLTVDFHKLFYQPISCGAFLVKNREDFRYIQHHADYLNPEKDDGEGIVNLVGKSTQTTRRFDALKLFFSLRMIGTKQFGIMIDHTINLASYTADYIANLENFRIVNPKPELNTVVFRYEPVVSPHVDLNQVNRNIQQHLLHSGKAVIAKTSVNGDICLKFTLLNPRTKGVDLREVLADIATIGEIEIEKWGLIV